MKGIILAGGTASRLFPVTTVVNKHLLPIYNKPMIYYPLSTLIGLGIRDVLIVVSPEFKEAFCRLLDDGSRFGIRIQYEIQETPRGIPDAFSVGKDFIGSSPVCLILGDNIFWGPTWKAMLSASRPFQSGARVFTKEVADPRQSAVLIRDKRGMPIEIIEKPENPASHEVVTGLYLFDADVVNHANGLVPSGRNELEITDLLKIYLRKAQLECERLGGTDGEVEWFDGGTPDSMVSAGLLIRGAEHSGVLIGSPEAVAFEQHFIDEEMIRKSIGSMGGTVYARNLQRLVNRPAAT